MSEGKFLLKTMSVLMMVFGLTAAVFAIMYLTTPENIRNWMGANVLLLITAVLEFIFGCLGFRSCDDRGHAGFFIITGIVSVVLALVSVIMAVTQWSLIALILPAYYVIGGMLLRRTED